MTRMLCLLAAALLTTGAARAQVQVVQTQNQVSPVVQVQGLAPQLVPFAGGDVNFANLVNGLFFGLPVTLTTPIGPGVTQVTSFTPTGTLTALQIAQLLESARQTAIANGIAAPTSQQVAVILNGGALPTPAGTASVNGLMGGTGASTATTTAIPSSPATLLQSQGSFATSDSPFPRGISDTPTSTVSTTIGTTSPLGTGTTEPARPATAAPVTANRSDVTGAGTTAAPAAARIATPERLGTR